MCAGVSVCVFVTWSRYFVYEIYWMQLNQLGDLKAFLFVKPAAAAASEAAPRGNTSSSLTWVLFLLTGVAGAPQQWPQCSPAVTWFLRCKSVIVPYFLLYKLQSSFLRSAVVCQLASTAVTSAEDVWIEFKAFTRVLKNVISLPVLPRIHFGWPALYQISNYIFTEILLLALKYNIPFSFLAMTYYNISFKPPKAQPPTHSHAWAASKWRTVHQQHTSSPATTLNLMRVNVTPGAVKFPLSCRDKHVRTHSYKHTDTRFSVF